MLGDRLLFLQGPLGPFFAQLGKKFASLGYQTHKINFNGGDWYYGFAQHQVNFVDGLDDWQTFIDDYLGKNRITDLFMYGDCRSYHRIARQVADRRNVRVWAFEEGYLRPDFVTLEPNGANANSTQDWSRETIAAYPPVMPAKGARIGRTFAVRAWFAASYYIANSLTRWKFPNYHHHREKGTAWEAFCWLRGGLRKLCYKVTQRNLADKIVARWGEKFFLVPLQVFNDAQIVHHSDYAKIEEMIEQVVSSFAKNAPKDHALVIKHHPVDRGFKHYGDLIAGLVEHFSLEDRVIYCHDAHLPTLERKGKGAVTISSTVGISCLIHRMPTKVLGRALYDIPGLTSQQSLDEFWAEPQPVDSELMSRFHAYIRNQTQLHGSYYKEIDRCCEKMARRLIISKATEQPSEGMFSGYVQEQKRAQR